ncbi:MAG: hypothetical protein HY922_05690 [Elusimicrobia bacterium]|nr:hypothetical protein [Elusimicrobiota bacterium]
MSMGEVRVGSGSFKVDRSRALDKLMRFQLPDARMFLVPWVQAAVASGASRIRILPQLGGIEMNFDGDPWTVGELQDPYRFLFEDDPDGIRARNRELAVGILSALRLKPAHISLTFDDRVERVLHIKSLTEDFLESDTAAPQSKYARKRDSETRLMLWVSLQPPFDDALAYVQTLCRHCPIPIQLRRDVINASADPREDPLRVFFKEQGIRGELALSPGALAFSGIDLVTHGATIAVEQARLSGAQGRGFVCNDGFRKSLSQAGVIKDERYEASLALVQRSSEQLLERAMNFVRGHGAKAGKLLLAPQLRRHWMDWEAQSLAEMILQRFSRVDPSGKEADILRRMSLAVAALRSASSARMKEFKQGRLSPLWEAPALFDTQGAPLSLRELDDQRLWLGYVPMAEDPLAGGAEGFRIAWIFKDCERRFIQDFFPNAKFVQSSDFSGARPALNEPNLLAAVPFRFGKAVGEIGLSLTPHTRSSRIRWLRDGRPISVSFQQLKGLRIEAAVENPALGRARTVKEETQSAAECLNAIAEAALGAYRKIAAEYDPSQAVPRQAVIREHLLDLATMSWDPERGAWKAHAWLEELALFRDARGSMLSMRELREAAAAGKARRLSASPHPESLREITYGYPDHIQALFGSSKLVTGIEPIQQAKAPAAPPPSASGERPRLSGTAFPKPPPPPKARRKLPAASAPATSVKPAAQELPRTEPQPQSRAEPASAEDLVLTPQGEFRRWLKDLFLGNASPLQPEQIAAVRLEPLQWEGLIVSASSKEVTLNTAHPLIRSLDAAGPLERRLPYLVSIFYTALNRAAPEITDEADIQAQLALVDYLLEPEARSKPVEPSSDRGV